jgi:NAD(P)-dependent dehydrogenase (short-subunit alcohol dehydrogenase family)
MDVRREELSLEGKTAVVTGAGRGIGRAAAKMLANAGAQVMVTARTRNEVITTVESIRGAGDQARGVVTDVASWSQVSDLVHRTTETFGPAEIVVANAGVLDPIGDTWDADPEEWRHNLEVNLIGVFNVTRAFLPDMVELGHGILIFVSSGAAVHSIAGWSAYCAAKAGLDQFGMTLAAEIDQRSLAIRVHVLYPGVVATAMQDRIRRESPDRFPLVHRFRGYYEQGWLRPPEEPATLVWWLSTPMAADLHGKVANLDDPDIRSRMSKDLGIVQLAGRGD